MRFIRFSFSKSSVFELLERKQYQVLNDRNEFLNKLNFFKYLLNLNNNAVQMVAQVFTVSVVLNILNSKWQALCSPVWVIADKTLIISRFYSSPLMEIVKCNLA